MKTKRRKSNHCHIAPALYYFFLRLNDTLGAEIVHRHRRKSDTCIEIVFYNELSKYLTGRLNTLKEAEACGYWIICRRQSKKGHDTWHGKTVFQLFLSPVHPKKRHAEQQAAAAQSVEITFEPIANVPHVHHRLAYTKIVVHSDAGVVRDRQKNVVNSDAAFVQAQIPPTSIRIT